MPMSIDELRREIRSDFLIQGEKLAALQADVATIRAIVDEHDDRRGTEVGALFGVRDTHEERLRKLERDYTPRMEHDAVAARVSTVEAAIARNAGIGWAIQAGITFIGLGGVAALIKFGGMP